MLDTNVDDKFFKKLLDEKNRDDMLVQCCRDVECVKRLCKKKTMRKTTPTDSRSPFPTLLIGIDIGGTLAKIVYFEPDSRSDATKASVRASSGQMRRHFEFSTFSGDVVKRDRHLEMPDCRLGSQSGTLHFVHLPSGQIESFLKFVESKGVASILLTICATGGGAQLINDHQNEPEKDLFSTKVYKYDELDCLLKGIHFIESCNPSKECYYYDVDAARTAYTKIPFDFSNPYPYLVVNIGSGVSILAVYSPTEYRRITGTSLGGGTFLGLCCLLTGCETFEEAIELAEKGDSGKVDKLVKDIYGGDYPKFNLRADTVASSFGNMNCNWRRQHATKEDLARATLATVTNNIGSIARMCAINEGYFGAVGCMVEHVQALKQVAQASPP